MKRVAAAACVLVVGVAAGSAGQSLGQVAADEAARRRTIATPARVITGADLRPAPPSDAPEMSAATDDAAVPSFTIRTPARYRGGAAPPIPVQALSGADIAVEVSVGRDGRVMSVNALRDAPPFTEALAAAVGSWQFDAAVDTTADASGEGDGPATTTPVESKVLVLAVFRPPALFQGTLGTPPVDVARASDTVPYPTAPLRMPEYPANALMDGVVLMEVAVAPDGTVGRTSVLRSAAGFDQSALDVAQTLRFRPARVGGRLSPALVYLAVAFRQPITP